MSNLLILGIIFVSCVCLGLIDYLGNVHNRYDYKKDVNLGPIKNAPWQWMFFQIWNKIINFLIAGFALYYLISNRLPRILSESNITLTDFVILLIISLCFFELLPYLLTNITQGINAMLKKILDK